MQSDHFPEPLIETTWHLSLHRLITKGWNLLFYIWRKHCLRMLIDLQLPVLTLNSSTQQLVQNMDRQPALWSWGLQRASAAPELPIKYSAGNRSFLFQAHRSRRGDSSSASNSASCNPSRTGSVGDGALAGISVSLTHQQLNSQWKSSEESLKFCDPSSRCTSKWKDLRGSFGRRKQKNR